MQVLGWGQQCYPLVLKPRGQSESHRQLLKYIGSRIQFTEILIQQFAVEPVHVYFQSVQRDSDHLWAPDTDVATGKPPRSTLHCREPCQALLTKQRHGPNPLSFCRHGPWMKELSFVILTCSFLSSLELAGKNVKVLIFLERSMRKHKAFCSCAQKIIYKVTIDICSRIFTKNVSG